MASSRSYSERDLGHREHADVVLVQEVDPETSAAKDEPDENLGPGGSRQQPDDDEKHTDN